MTDRNEEILVECFGKTNLTIFAQNSPMGYKTILEAMAISNKEAAIGFAEWTMKSDYDFNEKTGKWYDFIIIIEIDMPEITTEQLYEKYITHLNAKQP